MLSDEDVLEMIIHGYEQLRLIAEERGMTVDDLILKLRECMRENCKSTLRCVKIKEIRELTELDLEEEVSKFFPIQKEKRKFGLGLVKVKIK